MRRTYLTAGVIAILIGAWLLSGQLGDRTPVEHPTLAERNRLRALEIQDLEPAPVRARVIRATPQWREVSIRGRTENKRTLVVKSETTGQVLERPVDRGTRVAAGDPLCRLAMNDRQASLEEARAALRQARIDYEGNLRLRERGFQSETAIAQAEARVAATEAQVKRSELDVQRTTIRAPFPAIVEDVHVEVGDYATPGTACATLVDMDPMLLVGRVTERDVHDLEVNAAASGILSDGRTVHGTVTFIGQQSDPETRTYALEIEVPNGDLTLRSGITTRILVPVDQVPAHKVSPAIFALDDSGAIGIRTVNAENRVEYHRIRILRDDVDGVWVTGLPDVATIITVGQELVVPGQAVRVTYEQPDDMPASAPAQSTEGEPAADDEQTAIRARPTTTTARAATLPLANAPERQ
jgi:membrane fusion protein, multidrug efflux system